jgi:hypothetical protein
MSDLKKIDFMFELAFNKSLPDFYDQVQYKSDYEVLLNSASSEVPSLNDNIYMVYDVPSFLNVRTKTIYSNTGFKSVIQHKGYQINLDNYNDLEAYLKDRFGKSSLQLLRAGKKRLETCFDITYKMYYGNIDKDQYHHFFKKFYKMLELRASEKGIHNRNLPFWDLYTAKVYDMICSKEASLFVIYDGNQAINISLNMHVKNTVFLFISAYDVAYSKFRLGHTNWMMQLDWFLKNGIKRVDFSKGNVAYKKRWTNTEYDFNYHLFYNSSNMVLKLKALWIARRLQLLQTLRNKNINTYYYSLLDWFKTRNKSAKHPNYQLEDIDNLPNNNLLEPVLFREIESELPLKRIIYTALYLSFTHVKDLKVYRNLKKPHIYYLQSKMKVQKLILGK